MRGLNLFASHLNEAKCNEDPTLFGIPSWHKYLDKTYSSNADSCGVEFTGLNDFILVAFAVAEMLIAAAGLVAVGYIIYGAIQMVMSQGSPDRLSKARETISNAIIGLILVLISTAIVGFIARNL